MAQLESAIRQHLAPLLRDEGFKGSGKTFRRVVGDWIQVVDVQASRSGGQFAVSLGLQPVDVPDVLGHAPDLKKIAESQCEFRRRMSEPRSGTDQWWPHDATEAGVTAAVLDAIGVYERTGRALLDEATAETSDLNTVTASRFASGAFDFLGFGSTTCRMAFTLARLRKVKGDAAEARAFADIALASAGGATSVLAAIRKFQADS